jgi:hypothetical protein
LSFVSLLLRNSGGWRPSLSWFYPSWIYMISQELEHYDCIDKPPGLAGCPMR